MTAAWVLYLLLVGTLLALGARAVAGALGLVGRPTRGVWLAAFGGVVVFAVAAPRAPTVTSASGPGVPHAAPAVGTRARGGFGDLLRGGGIAFAADRIPARLASSVRIAWPVASAGLLALYVIVHLRFARARRHWPRRRVQGVDVRVAPGVGPAVIGLLRAEVVVPRGLLDRGAEEQRLVLAHEREHLRAGDHRLLALAWAAVIVLPWHPALWYLLARLRLAIELDCDARVLRRGASPRAYGTLLIDMAARGAGIPVGTLALADTPSHLERRLLAMTTPTSRYVRVRAGSRCALAGLLLLAACEARVPTSTEPRVADAAAKAGAHGGSADPARFVAKADLFVNGARVTREQARALDATRIGSVTVVRGAARDTVFVVTSDQLAALDR